MGIVKKSERARPEGRMNLRWLLLRQADKDLVKRDRIPWSIASFLFLLFSLTQSGPHRTLFLEPGRSRKDRSSWRRLYNLPTEVRLTTTIVSVEDLWTTKSPAKEEPVAWAGINLGISNFDMT